MGGENEIDYEVFRHAPVHGDVDRTTQWCLEYWDDRGEADCDVEVSDEASAVDVAQREFGITPEDWRAGPQPWGRPE